MNSPNSRLISDINKIFHPLIERERAKNDLHKVLSLNWERNYKYKNFVTSMLPEVYATEKREPIFCTEF